MPREEFEKLVAEEFPHAIPEKFRDKIANVAFIVESEPSPALRREERLPPNVTLLGHYRGIPQTSRGNYYGVGNTLPDTITLFQKPIENLAIRSYESQKTTKVSAQGRSAEPYKLLQSSDFLEVLRKAIRDTIWHEVAHHFGMNEFEVRSRERERKTKK